MGRGSRIVSADHGSGTGILHHRSSLRRAVHDLSGYPCAADEPRSPRRMDGEIAPGSAGGDYAALDQARIFAHRDRHDDARRAGEAAGSCGPRTSRPRRGCGCGGLLAGERPGRHVPGRRAGVQGRRARGPRRQGDALSLGPGAVGAPRARPGHRSTHEGLLRGPLWADAGFHAGARRRDSAARSVRAGAMPQLIANGVRVDDTFAEAFGETPDGGPGVRVLLFAVSTAELQKQLQTRVGQCVLTSPGSACYAGLAGEETLKLGNALRYFGDGWQISKRLGEKRFWRVPVMDGEFVCEATTGLSKNAVGGGNLILMGKESRRTLAAAEAAAKAIRAVPDAIAPFPGGIARSGSKVGSKYNKAPASTNDAYCPTLKGAVESALDPDTAAVLEIVIDGLTPAAVAAAMRAAIAAVGRLGPNHGVARIGAGNYGGKLGPHHFHLKDLLP